MIRVISLIMVIRVIRVIRVMRVIPLERQTPSLGCPIAKKRDKSKKRLRRVAFVKPCATAGSEQSYVLS